MAIEFKDRLREEREKRELKQAELAALAGLPATTISHFENGSRKPSFDNLRRLSKALGVGTDYLMGLEDGPGTDLVARRIARHLTNATEAEIEIIEMMAKSMADRKSEKDG